MAAVIRPFRTFHIAGPFGLQMTFRTRVPGTLWFRYPTIVDPDSPLTGRRAQETADESPVEGTSAQSPTDQEVLNIDTQYYLDIPPNSIPEEAQEEEEEEEQRQQEQEQQETPEHESTPLSRVPSLTPTELNPVLLSSEEIVEEIQQLGIKVRDFAYEKLPPHLNPVPEIFDPRAALKEHDVWVSDRSRTTPISGKTLWRLINVGWVTLQEARKRWLPIDWSSLAAFEKKPRYPWKARKADFPTTEERYIFQQGRRADDKHLNESNDPFGKWKAPESTLGPSTRPSTRGEKRRLPEDGSDDEREVSRTQDPDSTRSDAKRRRIPQHPDCDYDPRSRPHSPIPVEVNDCIETRGAGPSRVQANPPRTNGTNERTQNTSPKPRSRRGNGLKRTETLSNI